MKGSDRSWQKVLGSGLRGSKTAWRLATLRVRQTRRAFREGLTGRPVARPGDYDPKLAQHYANLELPYGADLETVTQAWKRLAQRYHPDRHARDDERSRRATELLQALNEAYTELCRALESTRS